MTVCLNNSYMVPQSLCLDKLSNKTRTYVKDHNGITVLRLFFSFF